MAGDTVITVVGNLTTTPSCASPPRVRPSRTSRRVDAAHLRPQTNEWKDGETLFLCCSVWRQAAENVAESLQRGMRVIVSGPAEVAVVRDQGGREAHRLRDRRRRGRPVAALRHRQGHQDPARSAAAAASAARVAASRRRPVRPAGGPCSRRPRRVASGSWGGQQAARSSSPPQPQRGQQGGGWGAGPGYDEPPSDPSRSSTAVPVTQRHRTHRDQNPSRETRAHRAPAEGEHHDGQASCAQAQEEGLPVLQGEGRPTSTTRTPRCCASSSPTAARSAPVA